jgi:multidrug resistance efflux pump
MRARDGRFKLACVLAAVPAVLGSRAGAATTAPATAPTTSPATAPSADTTVVQRGTLKLAFDADGILEPVDPFEVRLSLHHYAGDLIVRRTATPNAPVAKGDVLLSFDTDPIDRQIAAAESACAVARAGVTKADADVALGDKADANAMEQARQSLADAEAELKRWDATDGPAALAAGDLVATQAGEGLEEATDELAQLRQMYKSEDLTNQTADIVLKRAVHAFDIAKVNDQVAKAAADRATKYEPSVHRHTLTATVATQSSALDQLRATQAQSRVVRADALATARATADSADRDLADLKRDRAALTITSPIDGVLVFGAFEHKAWQPVDPKHLAVDQKVQADSSVLMTVYQPGNMRAVVACPESKLTLMPPGTRLTVAPAAVPGVSYDGTCGPASPFASGDKDAATVDVPVALPPVDRQLVPGYVASVGVDVPPADNVLLVPATAPWHGKVIVHADGKDEPRSVTLGRTDGKQFEVRSGLKEGEAILTQGKPNP